MISSVNLGSAAKYAVLGASTVTSTGFTTVRGLLGVSPGTALTGSPSIDTLGLSALSVDAHADLQTAYGDAADRASTQLLSGDLAGLTLTAGVYKSSAGMELTTGDLVLDGTSSDVFIFQMATTFIAAADRKVRLKNGAQADNVYWQIGSSATFGIGSQVVGTFMAYASITATTGAAVYGRLLALNAAITLDTNIVRLTPPLQIIPGQVTVAHHQQPTGSIQATAVTGGSGLLSCVKWTTTSGTVITAQNLDVKNHVVVGRYFLTIKDHIGSLASFEYVVEACHK